MSLLFLLLCINNYLALMYFLLYCRMLVLLSLGLLQKESKAKEYITDSREELNSFLNVSFVLLVFSGLPPFLGFISKLYLFSSTRIEKCVEGLLKYYVIWIDLSVLGGVKLGLLLSIVIVLQSIGYIKFFIHLYSLRSYKMLVVGRKVKQCSFFVLPLGRLVLLSLLFLWYN